MPEIPDVVVGNTVEDEWGNDIRDRTLQRYPSVAGRSSEHPTPAAGDLSYLEDSGAVEVFHAAAWRGLLPVGVVLPYAGAAAPTGFVLAQGQAISRTDFAALFALIGTTYGAGDGTTTFNVPNLQQRFPLGKAASGTGSALGATGGAIDHAHLAPSHAHNNPWTSFQANHQHSHSAGSGTGGSHAHTNPSTGSAGSHAHNTGTAIGGTAGSGVSSPLVSQTGHDHNTDTEAAHAHTVGNSSTGGDHNHPVNTGDGAGGHQHTQAPTEAGGSVNTGTQNPPYLSLNFIIRV